MKATGADVIVVGAGAGGAAVAGALAGCGIDVLVLEAGPDRPDWPRGHARNLDPGEAGLPAFADLLDRHLVYPSGSNIPGEGLSAFKVGHGVGGMLALWTNNCPSPHDAELPAWDDRAAWRLYLDKARRALSVRDDFGATGYRANRLLDLVRRAVGELPADRAVRLMPVAQAADGQFISVLDLLTASGGRPRVRPNVIVRKVIGRGDRVTGVEAYLTDQGEPAVIEAKAIVVAAGTVGSAKLLAASGVETERALGTGIYDHPAIASRVRLRADIRDSIPAGDPLFTVWVPFSPEHPWHNQLCRFPLSPAPVPTDAPPQETIDIFTWVAMDVSPENRLIFHFDRLDPFGLPEVSARVALSPADKARAAGGLAEHFRIAAEVGDLTEGWNPAFYRLGESTHLMGSCRMGPSDDGHSVVSAKGRVWSRQNLFVAGNAVLAQTNAGNPTLTTVAAALRCADELASVI